MTLSEERIRKLSAAQHEPEWMLNHRLQAWQEYQQYELPRFKYGKGVVLDLSALDVEKIDPHPYQEVILARPETIKVLSFSEALPQYADIIREHFNSAAKTKNKFGALHEAGFTKGQILLIPRGATLVNPLMLASTLNTSTQIEHLIIIAEQGSVATIIEILDAQQDTQQFRSQVVSFYVEEGAQVKYRFIQRAGPKLFNLIRRTAVVGQEGSLTIMDCTHGGALTQVMTSTHLRGEGAESKVYSLVFADQQQQIDMNTETSHHAPHTFTDMQAKLILNDHARAIYRGLIHMNKTAPHSTGTQREDTLLLSDSAHVDAAPTLEINHHDVKCHHAATISQPDEESLFYLMSRGMDKKTAQQLMVYGFIEEMLTKLGQQDLIDHVIATISRRLGEKP